jgi:hypothetical protein
MTASDTRPGERVKDVRFTEESLSVDLLDGAPLQYRWLGIQGCFTQHQSNGPTGRSVVVDTASTGRRSTRI